MKNFLLIYHSPAEATTQMANFTPEEQAEGMKPWMAWKEKMGSRLVDLGTPMTGLCRMNPDGSEVSLSTEASGYSIVQANSLDDAKLLLKGHPHLQWSDKAGIEIFECHAMN
ncbi:MAG: hypothetical protein AB8B74_13215 [Crocinitomicaceae bacterium]